ncbi:unnamed protein product [Calicophoron daubneyi]|uniref:UBA domain-containing protein n=1 Tax=Calicophoron daubneyi TaxID=300641 RepID=A0AAV2T470_CALDB
MDEFLSGNNTNVDVEESVRKILLMGITDEKKIRNTLKLTNYDINETITMICCGNDAIPVGNANTSLDGETVNKVVAGQNTTQSALDPLEKLVVGHDVSIEFSSLEFSRLQTRVYTDQWDIPCRRAQSFGLCLLGAIHELQNDGLAAFELTPDIHHFVCTCVVDCVTKLITSQAVFNWDRDTLEGVHNMLELAVRLICEYFAAFKQGVLDEMKELNVGPADSAKQQTGEYGRNPSYFACNQPLKTVAQFRMELLRLLALIFDCETNYHQSCRDRSTSTGTYAYVL